MKTIRAKNTFTCPKILPPLFCGRNFGTFKFFKRTCQILGKFLFITSFQIIYILLVYFIFRSLWRSLLADLFITFQCFCQLTFSVMKYFFQLKVVECEDDSCSTSTALFVAALCLLGVRLHHCKGMYVCMITHPYCHCNL